MKPIGTISLERLQEIPKANRAHHEFCFHLHDLMVDLLRQMELQNAAAVSFNLENEDEKALLSSGIHILDFLAQTGREDLERRAVINHVCNALFADMLHFIYEALRALEKRKFTVALSLLRKPFKEGLLVVAQMCGDETAFFNKMKTNAKNLLNRKELTEETIKALFNQAIEKARASGVINGDSVYDTVFNFQNEHGFARLFDKATHLVTEFSRNQTDPYNLNFIFKDPRDNDLYTGDTYQQIAQLLLFAHMMQVELYGRMKTPSQKYQNWMLFSTVGAFQALFTKGRSSLVDFARASFGEYMECTVCGAQLRLTKANAARFFISERIDCDECLTNQHFPFGWLLSKVDVDFLEQSQSAKQNPVTHK